MCRACFVASGQKYMVGENWECMEQKLALPLP